MGCNSEEEDYLGIAESLLEAAPEQFHNQLEKEFKKWWSRHDWPADHYTTASEAWEVCWAVAGNVLATIWKKDLGILPKEKLVLSQSKLFQPEHRREKRKKVINAIRALIQELSITQSELNEE